MEHKNICFHIAICVYLLLCPTVSIVVQNSSQATIVKTGQYLKANDKPPTSLFAIFGVQPKASRRCCVLCVGIVAQARDQQQEQ